MNLIGHKKQWNYLSKMAEKESLAHCLLFSGPEKTGKRTLAFNLSKIILKGEVKNNPDFLFLDSREAAISDVRKFQWNLSLKSYNSKFKVGVIDNADLLKKDSQNCLLKTLEEPTRNTILILIASFEKMLLDTVLSRTQIIRFAPFSFEKIKEELAKMGESEADEISKISFGKMGYAIEFSEDKKKLKNFKKIFKDIEEAYTSQISERFDYIKRITDDKNDILEIVEIWQRYFRRRMILDIINKREKETLKLKDILNKIEDVKLLIRTTNVNKKLALEELMLEL